MNMEKFTERSRGFIQAAQTIAIRENQQRVVPEHLLKALMDDDQGLAANLITRAGGDARAVAQAATVMAITAASPERRPGRLGRVDVDGRLALRMGTPDTPAGTGPTAATCAPASRSSTSCRTPARSTSTAPATGRPGRAWPPAERAA